MVTVADVTILNIGAAFWGLVAGIVMPPQRLGSAIGVVNGGAFLGTLPLGPLMKARSCGDSPQLIQLPMRLR